MELLTVSGPLTATELADLLDETPANCSWHLRKLAEHAFVEEAGGGIGRQRPWQVRSIGLAWDDVDASPGELRAGRALEELLLQRQVTRFQQARAQLLDDGERAWAEAASSTQHASWLTTEELDSLNLEIRAVLERYADRLTDPALRPAGSRLCELVAWGAPLLLPGVEPVAAEDAPAKRGRVVRQAFRQPGFTRLYAGLTASMFGDSAMLLVLSIWVKTITGSNAQAGLTFFFIVIPALFAPLMGIWHRPGPAQAAAGVGPPRLGRDASCRSSWSERAGQVWIIWMVAALLRRLVHRPARRAQRAAQGARCPRRCWSTPTRRCRRPRSRSGCSAR